LENKTQKIIDRLMSDPDYYREKSQQESNTWGKILSDDRRNDVIKTEQQAAHALGLNRHQIHIIPSLEKHALQPEAGLSLACGNGRAERFLMQSGVCKKFHGIDIATEALATAKQAAEKEGLAITYQQADLNDVVLPDQAFDFVVTQNCLHHVLRLEHLAQQIQKSLKPGGTLWISDFIGETQFQFTDKRMEIVNKVLSTLPEKFKADKLNNRKLEKLIRPDPGSLVSPFEAIRSADIMPVFLDYFDVIDKSEYDSILKYICPPGVRQAYNENESSKALFETLMLLDELLINEDVLSPVAGTFLLKAK
jgi:2-polyprenyl-3-methyl-5-hydroxy-6-metoxy-1,4-benzoquinol methylase